MRTSILSLQISFHFTAGLESDLTDHEDPVSLVGKHASKC